LLREAGVADSNAFGPPAQAQQRRATLAALIHRHAAWFALQVVDPDQVDAAVRRHRLNVLERQVAEQLLAGAPASARIIFDGQRLFGPLAARLPRAEARNRAESSALCVAAASILAKTERDRCFAEIRARYEPRFGPVQGEGYPNRATARFLAAYLAVHTTLPPETRRSWSWPPVAAHTTPEERGEAPALALDS
jgi:ribonuclease HII